MPKLLLLFVFVFISNLAISQNNSYIKRSTYMAPQVKKTEEQPENKLLYGPLPYRTLQETIGETYVVLPLSDYFIPGGYTSLFKSGGNKNVIAKEGEGKLLKLTSINETEGHFTDSTGIEYVSKMYENTFNDLAPIADIDNSRKLFLNKPLWLNIDYFATGDPYGINGEPVKKMRFTKVLVTDILASYSNNAPVLILFKTDNGVLGFTNACMSGTNSQLNPKYFFNEKFFTENPQITYKLTPKVWAAVKAGKVEIGMPTDAIRLIEGRPTKRNITTTGATTTEQWVYGDTAMRFFYFTNGKLTSWSN